MDTALADFCPRNHIRRLAFFGSVLGGDFRPESDLDVLVRFEPRHVPGLIRFAGMERELSGLLEGRRVDMRTPEDLSRHFRDEVVASAEVHLHKNDAIRLRHMLDTAREALSFSAGKTRRDLDTDRMLVLSLVKSIEIIGEAAGKVSLECRSECPAISWADIIAMRSRLIHAYFDINLDIVWQTVKEELSPLINELGKAVSCRGVE